MKHLRNGILATVIVGLGFIGAADARDFHRDGGRRGIETHQWHKADKHGAHAHADSRYQRHVERRRARQEHRIEEGWHSGQLTRKELKRLRKNQRRIAHMERKFLGDGYFSRRERRAMDEALDEASGRIYRKKHNERHRLVRHRNRDRGEFFGLWSDGLGFIWYDLDS